MYNPIVVTHSRKPTPKTKTKERLQKLMVHSRKTSKQAYVLAQQVKFSFVSRLFWGRGNLYRRGFHYAIITISTVAIILGLLGRVSTVNAGSDELNTIYGAGISNDMLQQGGSIQTVNQIDPNAPNVEVKEHVVKLGETLEGIAKEYDLDVDTVRWANNKVISPFSNYIEAGWKLNIPQINGIFVTVARGETLDSIVTRYGYYNVHPLDIIELNDLNPQNPVLTVGQKLFIPNGRISSRDIPPTNLKPGELGNPLSHPNCAGYRLTRGFTGYHDGLDLAKYPGCPVRAIAPGDVIFVGWTNLAGYNVRIDHGGGVVSHYYHSDGTFWVKEGDHVQLGQEIMMMGTSGNSTGVHLHLTIRQNGVPINPAPYVPFRN